MSPHGEDPVGLVFAAVAAAIGVTILVYVAVRLILELREKRRRDPGDT